MTKLFKIFLGIPLPYYIIIFLFTTLSFSLWLLQGKIEEVGGYKVAQKSYISALKASENAREKDKQSCSLTDLINTEYQEQKKERSDKKDKILAELNKLEAKPSPKPKQEASINEKPNVSLDIDSKLPDDLRMLLDKACNPNKDGVCVYAK